MNTTPELFPLNIAIGKAFCNRVQERGLLKQYIKHGRHTVLLAPRRYGKTSLINQVLLELDLPYCLMELILAVSVADVERIIILHISHLLYEILPKTLQAKQKILELFKWLNPELILTAGGQKLVFHPENSKTSTVENIAELLKKLDDAAVMANKKVVVVMDEFQQLNELKNHAIEASIRHAMQYSRQVSYVFLGSNRHMLLSMFNSKNRPFYNSCEIMKLERISIDDYVPFIQQAAHAQWKKKLPPETLEKIFVLSELNPNYINRICGYFWLSNEFPTVTAIEQYWRKFIESKRVEFTENLSELSKNQKRVLAYLAKNPTDQPGSQDNSHAMGLSEASIRQALKKLILKDYIYKDKTGIIRVLDPALRDFINYL